jgi:nitric oxide reductase NorQ protein
MATRQVSARADNDFFRAICRDILDMDSAKVRRDGASLHESPADEVVARISNRPRRPKSIDAKVDTKIDTKPAADRPNAPQTAEQVG